MYPNVLPAIIQGKRRKYVDIHVLVSVFHNCRLNHWSISKRRKSVRRSSKYWPVFCYPRGDQQKAWVSSFDRIEVCRFNESVLNFFHTVSFIMSYSQLLFADVYRHCRRSTYTRDTIYINIHYCDIRCSCSCCNNSVSAKVLSLSAVHMHIHTFRLQVLHVTKLPPS